MEVKLHVEVSAYTLTSLTFIKVIFSNGLNLGLDEVLPRQLPATAFTQSSEHAIFVIYRDAHQSGSMHRQSHQVSVFLNLHTKLEFV